MSASNTASRIGAGAGSSIAAVIAVQEPARVEAPSTVALNCGHEEAIDDANARFERSRLALIRTGDLSVVQQ